MKRIKQIRENYDILTERDEAETRKLTSLVRAGLFDSKKLPMLKRALNKDPKDMTPAERKILIELLDSLMGEVLGSQQVFQKVRQDVMKEAKAPNDYLSKYDPRFKDSSKDEKQIPTIIILKRKAIRFYPDNQRVALYYSQALDKYVTIPFGGVSDDAGPVTVRENFEYQPISEAVEKMSIRDRFKAKRKIQEEEQSKAAKIASNLGDAALDMTPVVGTYRAGQRAVDAYKAGNYGQAALHGGLTALSAAGDAMIATGIGAGAGVAAKGLLGAALRKIAGRAASGEAAKEVAAGTTAGSKVATGAGTSTAPKAVEPPKPTTPEPPKAETPKATEPPKESSKGLLDNLPGVKSSKTAPEASNSNSLKAEPPPKVEPPKAPKEPVESPIGGGKKEPSNTNLEPEIKGTGTTGPAIRPQKAEPPKVEKPYETGVEIKKGQPDKPSVNDNAKGVEAPPKVAAPKEGPNTGGKYDTGVKVDYNAKPKVDAANDKAPATAPAPAQAPAKAPAQAPATAPAPAQPVTKPAPAPNTNPAPAPAPAPAQAQPQAAPQPRLNPDPAKAEALPKTNPKPAEKPPVKPLLPGLPDLDGEVLKQTRDPLGFSLKAKLSKPEGHVRTGVQTRDNNNYRKQIQQFKEENSEDSEKEKSVVKKYARKPKEFLLKANTSSTSSSSDSNVRTGVSARDAMMYRRSLQNENVLVKLKGLRENQELNLTIGDSSVVINNTVANKILSVYESVNKENKQRMESMLNESIDSIKKIIDFAARQ